MLLFPGVFEHVDPVLCRGHCCLWLCARDVLLLRFLSFDLRHVTLFIMYIKYYRLLLTIS